VRELSDLARKTMGITCVLQQSHGVNCLSDEAQSSIRELVETFTDFTTHNDPYNEHDMGKITYRGITVFWKLDYYDLNLEYHSEDASDPRLTKRVLTIMLADEY
jgi:hypothetical protein